MNQPFAPSVFRWLVRDTFLQSRASGLFWLLLGINCLVILVCLSVGIEGEGIHHDLRDTEFLPQGDKEAGLARSTNSGVTVPGGEFTLAFGAIRFPLHRDVLSAVRFFYVLLAWGVADTLGILMALVWTAGFMPRFLDRSTAPLRLAKPVPLWQFVVGKYLGGLAFVAFHALVFFLGTWLALGVRTGVLEPGYFLCVPLMLFHFAVFYAVSVLVAVLTRSTVASIIGSIAFWFLCWGINYGHHALLAMSPSAAPSGVLMSLSEVCYWILPKPADFGMLLFESLRAESFFNQLPEFRAVTQRGAFLPWLSLLSSALFGVFVLGVATRELSRRDQ
jgi:ABC-type transport system involved in multi-copper enzyme maturation permease subunit